VSTIGPLLAGIAAMMTAAAGLWHPPVPVPIRIVWVGPSATTAQTPPVTPLPAASSQAVAATPEPSPLTTGAGRVSSGVTLKIESVTPSCCGPQFFINIGATNTNINSFILAYDSDAVMVQDNTSHVYPIAHSGNRQVNVAANADDQSVIQLMVQQTLSPSAVSVMVTFPLISGTENVQLTRSLR
jgi:hypothetical protein